MKFQDVKAVIDFSYREEYVSKVLTAYLLVKGIKLNETETKVLVHCACFGFEAEAVLASGLCKSKGVFSNLGTRFRKLGLVEGVREETKINKELSVLLNEKNDGIKFQIVFKNVR